MTLMKNGLPMLAAAMLITGCVVREEPPRHRVYVYDPLPPEPVEVVPAQPGPEYVYVQGVYVQEGGHWVWHHGYWRR